MQLFIFILKIKKTNSLKQTMLASKLSRNIVKNYKSLSIASNTRFKNTSNNTNAPEQNIAASDNSINNGETNFGFKKVKYEEKQKKGLKKKNLFLFL
jgi:hypothetical protein